MKTILTTCVLFLFCINFISAQSTLNAGDIAIAGIDTDNPDDFAFVLLTDIEANTVINFTDNGWLSTGEFRSGEGVIAYTSPSSLSAGTVIIYSVNSSDFSNVSGGFSLSANGDQIIAFQGDVMTPTLIYALNDEGAGVWQPDTSSSNTSDLPTGLVEGYSAVALNEVDNAYYSDGPYTDLNVLRSAIGNNTLWTGDNTTPYDFTMVFADGSLPVELSSFTAVAVGDEILLKWRTETEVNNYGFEILRKAQYDKWRLLGFVEGSGNSNSPKEYNFTDESVSAGTYFYRLKQIDNDGSFEYSQKVEIAISSSMKFKLEQNYPNPFNPTTAIRFTIPEAGNVKLCVYNLLGEQIEELVNGFKEAGVYTIDFNASKFNSGVYIYKLTSGNYSDLKKLILLK